MATSCTCMLHMKIYLLVMKTWLQSHATELPFSCFNSCLEVSIEL